MIGDGCNNKSEKNFSESGTVQLHKKTDDEEEETADTENNGIIPRTPGLKYKCQGIEYNINEPPCFEKLKHESESKGDSKKKLHVVFHIITRPVGAEYPGKSPEKGCAFAGGQSFKKIVHTDSGKDP